MINGKTRQTVFNLICFLNNINCYDEKKRMGAGYCYFFSCRIGNRANKTGRKSYQKGSEIVIPYEKYVLPNGLTVIVHEDHCDPVVHVDVTYHVGSAREEIGKVGLCALF